MHNIKIHGCNAQFKTLDMDEIIGLLRSPDFDVIFLVDSCDAGVTDSFVFIQPMTINMMI